MESATSTATEGRPDALGAKTMAEAFQLTAAQYADRPAIRTKEDEQSYTWAQYAEKVEQLARGLAALGLQHGDTMGSMLTNRPEFHFFDTAAMHLGAAPFSAYNTYTVEQVTYLIEDSGAKIMVTERAFLDTVLAVRDADTPLEHVIVVDTPSGAQVGEGENDTLTVAEVIDGGDPGFDFEAAWKGIDPEDVITLIYTSGTTGPPKGVELTHDNIVFAIGGIEDIIQFPDGGRVISWLPYAHVAERQCSQYLPMVMGFTTTDCPDPRQVMAYMPEVRPTWFFAVPRIWEKLKAGLEAMVAGEQDEQKKAGLQKALEVGLKKVKLEQAGEPVPDELAAAHAQLDEQVLSKVRETLGFDQIVAVNVGAAPTPAEVLEFFHAIGVPVAELWGMSETCGAGAVNPPDKIKIGYVGPPTPGCEIKLADDGEVLIKSRFVMKGYRNLPDETAEALDEEGWLHTGDIGEFDDDGYLKLVDRKKELIINAAGKNMSPANIEAHLKASSSLIGQAVAIGDQRAYNVALITLDPDFAPGFIEQNGQDAVEGEVQRGIDGANERLARVEQIKKFKILDEDWQPGGDELTPTMKLKRKPISQKYEQDIEALYAD